MRRNGTSSIIPGDREDRCFFCGRYGQMHFHHMIEGSCRNMSEKYGLKIHLCPSCHEFVHHAKGAEVRLDTHKMAQTEYEEMRISEGMTPEEARDDFRKHFNKSWL